MADMKTGFIHVDGSEAQGREPARPHHWLVAVVAVIVAQWLMWQGAAFSSVAAGEFLRFGFIGVTGEGATSAYVVSNLIFLFVPTAVLAALTLYCVRKFDGRSAKAIGIDAKTAPIALVWSIAGLLATSPVILAALMKGPDGAGLIQGIVILTPVTIVQAGAEEILFRGVLLAFLSARYGAVGGILTSALMFGLWHMQIGQSWLDAAVMLTTSFVFGITAGIVTLHYANLGPALALHVVWNVAAYLYGGSEWGSDFWPSWVNSFNATWTMERVVSGELVKTVVLPLVLETFIVFAAARDTIYRLLGREPARL